MIRAIATGKDGRQVLFLGLSDLNVQRLKEGLPIHMYGEEIGAKVDVVIVYGATEDAIRRELLGDLIGPETVVRDHRVEKKQ